MNAAAKLALSNAAASSAMEGLPLDAEHMQIAERILDGMMTLEEYLQSLVNAYQEK